MYLSLDNWLLNNDCHLRWQSSLADSGPELTFSLPTINLLTVNLPKISLPKISLPTMPENDRQTQNRLIQKMNKGSVK